MLTDKSGNSQFLSIYDRFDTSNILQKVGPDFLATKLPPPSFRVMANINGGSFIANSSVEGGTRLDEILEYFVKYLKESARQEEQDPVMQEIIHEVELALELERSKTFIKTAQHQIRDAFAHNRKMLIAGGWTGTPIAHAVYYEIIPTDDGKAVFRVYNSGAGSKNHDQDPDPHSRKVMAYKGWKGIDRTMFLEKNFLQAMHELKTSLVIPTYLRNTNYGETDIYKNLVALLGPSELEKDGPEVYSKISKAHTCLFDSLCDFLKTRMQGHMTNGLGHYKRVKCQMRIQTQVDSLKHPPRGIAQEARWRVVYKSLQKVARSIDKNYKREVFSEEYRERAISALDPVARWVKDHSADTLAKIPEVTTAVAYKPLDAIPVKVQIAPSLRIQTEQTHHKPIEAASFDYVTEKMKSLSESISNRDDILEILEKALDVCRNAWQKGEDQGLFTGLMLFVGALPGGELSGSVYWTNTYQDNVEKAEEIINKLGELQKYIFKTLFTVPQAQIVQPERYHALFKLLMIQEQILDVIMPKHAPLIVSWTNTNDRFLNSFETDAVRHREMVQWVEQWSKFASEVTDQCSFNNNGLKLQISQSERRRFAALAYQAIPTLQIDIAKRDPNFLKYSVEIQEAYIYTSNKLPSWLVAIRDLNIYINYLRYGPIAKADNIDRQKDLHFDLKVEGTSRDPTISVYFSGISDLKDRSLQGPRRLAAVFGNFNRSSSGDIEKLLHDKEVGISYANEKTLLSHLGNSDTFSLTPEAYVELTHPYQEARLSIIETLSYFSRYPNKLIDRSYQIVIQTLLFSGKALDEYIETSGVKFVQQKIDSFVYDLLQRFQAQNELQAYLFALRLGRQLTGFISHSKLNKEVSSALRKLLKSEVLSQEERSQVYAELIAYFADLSELTAEDCHDLLVGSVHLNDSPLRSQVMDPRVMNQVHKALHLRAHSIKGYLGSAELHQDRLNKVLHALHHDEDQYWRLEEHDGRQPIYVSVNGKYSFLPLQGRFITNELQMQTIPDEIAKHYQFVALFPGIKRAKRHAGDVHEFCDASNKLTLVKKEEDHLIIQQRMENGLWVQFVPMRSLYHEKNGHYSMMLGSRYLLQEYTHWMPLEGPQKILMVHKKRGLIEYEADLTQGPDGKTIVSKVRRSSDKALLGRPSDLFTRFEDPCYIHEWYNADGKLMRVELPRFNLSFTAKDTRLECDQIPKYYLSSTTVSQLGSFSHYLHLEDSRGNSRILMPDHLFSVDGERDVLIPHFQLQRNLELGNRTPQKYYVYHLKKEANATVKTGKLIAVSTKPNLHLALALATVQNYQEAALYLRRCGEKPSNAYDPSEIEILKRLTNLSNVPGDEDANAWALGVYAGYLVLLNDIGFGTNALDKKLLERNYREYLHRLSNVTALRLTATEESFVRGALKCDVEFDHKVKQERDQSTEYNRDAMHFAHAFIRCEVKDLKVKPIKREELLLTRIEEHLKENFASYYMMAINGSEEEKKWLRDALHFLSPSNARLAILFEWIITYPTEFPLPSLFSNLEDWKKEVLKAVDKVYQEPVRAHVHHSSSQSKTSSIGKPAPQICLDDLSAEFEFSDSAVDASLKKPFFSEALFKTFFKEKDALAAKQAHQHNLQVYREWIEERLKATESDAMQHETYQQLIQDLNSYSKLDPPPVYSLKTDATTLRKTVESDKEFVIQNLRSLKGEILTLLHRMPADRSKTNERLSRLWGETDRPMTLDEAIICFGRSDATSVLQRNPTLTQDEIKHLFTLIYNYLLLTTREQQRERVLENVLKLEELEKETNPDAEVRADLIQQIAQDIEAKRCYDPAQNHTLLVVEHHTDILLWSFQKDALTHLLDRKVPGTNEEVNQAIELIMGSGKSKILLPLLVLLRTMSKKKTLPLLVSPSATYENTTADANRLLQGAAGIGLRAFTFSRKSKTDPGSLKELHDLVTTSIALSTGDYSIGCLILKFIEKCDLFLRQPNLPDEWPADLILMRSIINELVNKGIPLFDEWDSISNALRELCFSIGESRSPSPDDYQVISVLYGLLYETPALKAIARLESDSNPNMEAPALTEKLYDDRLKPALADAFISSLKTMTFEHDHLKTRIVQEFGRNVDSKASDRQLLLHFLCNDKDHITASGTFYHEQCQSIQDVLSLAGWEIAHALRQTLTIAVDEGFGCDDRGISIPNEWARSPRKGSQYANEHITMNDTFQANEKGGIPTSLIDKEIERLRAQAIQELISGWKENGIDKEAKFIEETPAWKKFNQYLAGGSDIPFKMSPVQREVLYRRVNASSRAKRLFVQHLVLPSIEIYDEKLTFNPKNLGALFPKKDAVTGTLWNPQGLSSDFVPVLDRHITPKLMSVLFAKSRDAVTPVKEGTTQDMLVEVGQEPYDMLVDGGGYFRRAETLQNARDMAVKNKNPVLFCSDSGEQMITDGITEVHASQSLIAVKDRQTFLPQKNGIGFDSQQKANAKVVVTVGRHMTKRDFLQNMSRARKGQVVRSAVSPDVQSMIDQTPNLNKPKHPFDAIAHFILTNQCVQRSQQNARSLVQSLRNVPQKLLLDLLLHPKSTPRVCQKPMKLLRSAWFQKTIPSPSARYDKLTRPRPKDQVIQEEIQCYTKIIDDAFAAAPGLHTFFKHSDQVDQLEKSIAHLKDHLPPLISTTDSDTQQHVELEQRDQLQNHVQQQSQIVVDKYGDRAEGRLGFLDAEKFATINALTDSNLASAIKDGVPRFSLGRFLANNYKLREYAGIFEQINMTLNVLSWPSVSTGQHVPHVSDLKFFVRNRTPLNFVFIEGDRVTLLSQREAAQRMRKRYADNLYHVRDGFCLKEGKVSPKVQLQLLQIRFLDGDVEYTLEERVILKKWLKEAGPERMFRLLKEKILAGYPDKTLAYQGSGLQKVFQEILN